MKRSLLCCLILAPLLLHCADNEGASDPAPGALASAPIQLVDATVCSIDADCNPGLSCFLGACAAQCSDGTECASGECDARGRCTESGDKTATPGLPAGPPAFRLDGVTVVRAPDAVLEVPPGEQSVTVEIETLGAVLAQGGFSYRVESSIDPELGAHIFTSAGATVHRITLDTGLREGDATLAEAVSIRLITPLGDIPLSLKAEPTVGGHYTGTLKVSGLGATVPIEFGIQTERPTPRLEPSAFTGANANKAFLVAGAGIQDVFGPITGEDLPPAVPGQPKIEVVVAPLVYEADLDAWVAKFDNGFNIPAGESFHFPKDTEGRAQVRRELRYELRFSDGSFTGSLSDRFTGLYAKVASDGQPRLSESLVGGTISVERVGDEPAAETGGADGSDVEAESVVQPVTLSPNCEALAATFVDCKTQGTFEGAYACADALSAGTLGVATLTDVVAGLLSGEGELTESGATFEEFLEACAAGTEPLCVASEEAICAIEMHAVAMGLAPGGWSDEKEQLWEGFSALLLQTTGGPQLGAFYLDTKKRRSWLENATYGTTAITAAASAQLNATLMDDYFNEVVEVNARALRSYMAPSSFAFLSRGPDSVAARDQRDQLLISMVESWSATADSLALAAQRWNELYRLDGQRRIKADLIASRLRELYVNAAVIIQLHQEAGKAAEAAPIAASLGALLQRLATLERTFNDLLFDRYGQVTQTVSLNPGQVTLDPRQVANGVLTSRREAALEAVDDASQKVDTILASLLKDDIRNQDFYNKLNDRVAYSEGFLVELCGQPVGCDILTEEGAPAPDGICEVSWKPGVCGFDQPKGPLEDRTPRSVIGFESAASPSLAGLAIKAVKDATIDFQTSTTSLEQFMTATEAMQQTTDGFAASTEVWWNESKALTEAIDTLMRGEVARQDSRLKLHFAQITKLEASFTESAAKRNAAAAEWNKLRTASGVIRGGILGAQTAFIILSEVFAGVKALVRTLWEVGRSGVPGVVGFANDVLSGVRLAIGIGGNVAENVFANLSKVNEKAADFAELSANLAEIAFETELGNAETTYEKEEFAREMSRAAIELQDEKEQANDALEVAKLEQAIGLLERLQEVKQAHERDEFELRDRRNELLNRLVETTERMGAVEHARVAQDTAVLDYLRNCELAAQEKSALDMVRLFRSSIKQLVAGPKALFATANGLVEAERELDRAKRKMADWLVAMEFAAVRPFFNERMAILLARNTYQLRAIADRLRDLESRCGGVTNVQTSVLSVRDDLLNLSDAQLDATEGQVLSPADRFWNLAQSTALPDGVNTRYSAERQYATVSQGTQGNDDLFVMNFQLTPRAFANLRLTCNAKLESIAVRLVGDKLGGSQPVVTILYGGQSSMYSCQPGIDDYVATFAQGNTAYGSTSSFVTESRAISPVAGLAEMGSPNATLVGMPLASDYTIIIDPWLPANQNVDWTKLDDVELELSYSYQDLFGTESECANAL